MSTLKSVVVFGNTGEGKSTLLNLLSGDFGNEKHNFNESLSADSVTKTTDIKIHKWLGKDEEIQFCDTQGLNDTQNMDTKNIQQMVQALKTLEFINLFIIVINGTNPRFTRYTSETIKMFVNIFPQDVIGNMVFCFTNWNIRQKDEDQETQLANEYNTKFRSLVSLANKTTIPCFFIDSWYKRVNPRSKKEFYDSDEKSDYDLRLNSLYAFLCSTSAGAVNVSNISMNRLSVSLKNNGVSFTCKCKLAVENCTEHTIKNFVYRIVHIDNSIAGKILVGLMTIGMTTKYNRENTQDAGKILTDERDTSIQEFKIEALEPKACVAGMDNGDQLRFDSSYNHYHYIRFEVEDVVYEIKKKNWLHKIREEDDGLSLDLKIAPYEQEKFNICLSGVYSENDRMSMKATKTIVRG